MSPELRLVLNQAKQLNHTEQLELITHLVNHALPVEPPEAAAPTAPVSVEPPPAEPLLDPQCAEFLDELAQYQHTQQQP